MLTPNNVAQKLDITECTTSLLSMINDHNGLHGKATIIDVLSGSKRKDLKLTDTKYYGMYQDRKKSYLKLCLQYLVDCNLIVKSKGKFPTLSLTEHGEKWLKSENPYLVIQVLLPADLAVGMLEDMSNNTKKAVKNKKGDKKSSYLHTYDLFQQGKTLDEIAEIRNLTKMTIDGHLAECLKSGLDIDIEKLGYSKEKHTRIVEIIKSEPINGNTKKLKPIKDECDKQSIDKEQEEITYFDIKCVLALM